MNILSPSILSADFKILGEQIKKCEIAGAKYLHIDVMDGLFVPSISFGTPIIKSIKTGSKAFLDVHLMIQHPKRYIDSFCDAGADCITFHTEACDDYEEIIHTINLIKNRHCKAGLTIKPNTPIETLEPYMGYIDMILIMTVEPGFGGQNYIPSSTEKIKKARKLIEETNQNIDLEVDGGINLSNLREVLDAGANVIVAGSAIFKESIEKNVENFLKFM